MIRSELDCMVKTPQKIENIKNAKKILCKYKNTFYIDNDGGLYVIGSGERGVNGTGRKKENILQFEKIKFENDVKISEIDGGNSFCLALDSDGKVYSWGYNNFG